MPHFKFCNFQVVTDILHLHGQKLIAYKGDYDTYERTRVEQLKNQQKAFESNERSRAHMQVFHHTNSSYQQQLDSTQSTFVFFPKFTFFVSVSALFWKSYFRAVSLWLLLNFFKDY